MVRKDRLRYPDIRNAIPITLIYKVPAGRRFPGFSGKKQKCLAVQNSIYYSINSRRTAGKECHLGILGGKHNVR